MLMVTYVDLVSDGIARRLARFTISTNSHSASAKYTSTGNDCVTKFERRLENNKIAVVSVVRTPYLSSLFRVQLIDQNNDLINFHYTAGLCTLCKFFASFLPLSPLLRSFSRCRVCVASVSSKVPYPKAAVGVPTNEVVNNNRSIYIAGRTLSYAPTYDQITRRIFERHISY